MGFDTTQPSLLARIRDPQNKAAWREFETKYRDLILRYCRRRGLQESDAEDVHQVVLLNLSRALPNFEYAPARGRFRSYLGTVVRNAIAHQLNRPKTPEQALDTNVLANMAAPDGGLEGDELWEDEWINHHYRVAMQTIRETFESRSVACFDRLLAGAAVAEVAEAFGMTVQAVHKVKQRIRNRLQELIALQIQMEEAGSDSE